MFMARSVECVGSQSEKDLGLGIDCGVHFTGVGSPSSMISYLSDSMSIQSLPLPLK
jgi:hypothetical protein